MNTEAVGEEPRLALDEPKGDEQGREPEEIVEKEVGLRVERPPDDPRRDEHEQDERPQQERRDARCEQSAHGRDEAAGEEPELDVERHDVRRAHEVKGRRLERRDERADTSDWRAHGRTARRARRRSRWPSPWVPRTPRRPTRRALRGGWRGRAPRGTPRRALRTRPQRVRDLGHPNRAADPGSNGRVVGAGSGPRGRARFPSSRWSRMRTEPRR